MKNVPYISIGFGAAEVLQNNTGKLDYAGMKPTYKQLENYDHLIDKANLSIVDYGDKDLKFVLNKIQWFINKHHHQVHQLAKHLYDDDVKQAAFNIWHFIKHNITYKLDEHQKEQLRTPARTWSDRFAGVDCDDYTIFSAALLLCMKHQPELTTVEFNNNGYYSHIYNTVNGIVLDGVMSAFNRHPDFVTHTISIPMKVEGLFGLSLNTGDKVYYMNGLGAVAPVDATTARLMKALQQLRNIKNPTTEQINEAQKLEYVILMNGTDDRNYFLKMMPFIERINEKGNFVFKSQAIADYFNGTRSIDFFSDDELEELDEFLDVLDEYETEEGNDDELDGLGKIFGKEKRKLRKEQRKAAKEAKEKAAKQAKRDRIKETAKDFGRVLNKLNPVTAAARNAARALLALNMGNVAGRLRLGYITKEQALSEGWSEAAWNEAQKRKPKFEKKWKNLGGNVDKAKKSILKGGTKKPLFAKKQSNPAASKSKFVDGKLPHQPGGKNNPLRQGGNALKGIGLIYELDEQLGVEPVSTTATTLLAVGGSVLAALASVVAGIKGKKGEEGETEKSDKNFLDKAIDFGKNAVKLFKKNKAGVDEDVSDTEIDDAKADADNDSDDGEPWYKNPFVWVGGAAVVGGGIWYVSSQTKKRA
jgi:hypothetical protein